MSILETPIDYESLEGELHEALRADELYQLRNDAKIRAVEQRVPTYDHFKDMVSAAHLKPVDRSDMQPKLGVPWNTIAGSTSSKPQHSHCSHTMSMPMPCQSQMSIPKYQSQEDGSLIVPKTTEEFLQTWRKVVDPKRRFAYLLAIRPVSFIEIFRTEIPLGVLGEVMAACLMNLPEGDEVNTVIDILTALSHCNRFQLSVHFMTREENEIAKQLFRRLLARGKAGDGAAEVTVNMLRNRYKIKFD